MEFIEKVGNLFDAPKSNVLAHCISRDAGMGAGIAVSFRHHYPDMQSYLRSHIKHNDVLTIYDKRVDKSIVANLITKEKYWQKPTRKHIESSLVALRDYMQENGKTKLSMPTIAVGLDAKNNPEHLVWRTSTNRKYEGISEMIKRVFADTDIKITIYHFR